MSKTQAQLTDLLAQGGARKLTIEQRIDRRLEVLRSWLRDGIPAGKSIPKNLKAARVWEDPELGIARIASPNEFTSSHHLHGPAVREIAAVLTQLKKRFHRPKTASASSAQALSTRFDRTAYERQLERVVSQWHSERDLRLNEKKRADAAEARSIMLLQESAEKDELIADLRRQLVARKGLRAVE